MKQLRWRSVVLGAVAFLAAHAVMVAAWTTWFGPEWQPWFLNSGPGVLLTVGCIVIAGFLANLLAQDRRETLVHGGNVAAGAVIAMIATLFTIGAGTLFPIVIALGSTLIIASSFAGAFIAYPFKRG
jgi:hypothetical protein